MKNNQANNVAAPGLFGCFGTTPQHHHLNLMNQQWSRTNHQLSRFHPPQTHFPGQFQFSEPQSQLLAHAHLQSQSQSFASLHNNVNANVANVASTPSTTGSSKRATQRTPSRPPVSSGTNQNALFKTPNALQRKRKLQQEKQIPEKVIAPFTDSTLYTQLLDFEAQIDAVMDRRKVDIQEAIRCPPHVQKTLRIYVFNTFSNYTKIDSENKKTIEESSWSLKIIGRILEDGNDIHVSETLQRSKFSDFFKKITICLDRSLYPENHVIVWDNNAHSPKQQDGFEVKRKGDKEFTAVIKIEMSYSPEKFMVSPLLAKILGVEVETPPRIIAALWHYVKSKKLQCPDEPSFFICDPSLKGVFGEEKMKFTMAAHKLLEHLSHPQPIYLEHNIKLSGDCPAGTACYDIQVDEPIPLQKEMSTFMVSNSSESQKEIKAYDEVIHTSLKKIQEHHRRRALFLSFSQSPEEFISTMIASQSKDLKLVAGDSNKFYNQPWVEDAVIRYLNNICRKRCSSGKLRENCGVGVFLK